MYGWGCQKGSSTSGWFALPGICRMHHICRHSTCICTSLAACFKQHYWQVQSHMAG